MATTNAELIFMKAVANAEGVRQIARTAAFNTWAYGTGSAFTTYTAALVAADNTYINAIQSAANTMGATGLTIPNSGPVGQSLNITVGLTGQTNPIATFATDFAAIA